MQGEVTQVHETPPVELTLRTENVGSVRDKMTLLMGAFMKVAVHPARIIQIQSANFDEDPCVKLIIQDPVLTGLPDGTIRADLRRLPRAALTAER